MLRLKHSLQLNYIGMLNVPKDVQFVYKAPHFILIIFNIFLRENLGSESFPILQPNYFINCSWASFSKSPYRLVEIMEPYLIQNFRQIGDPNLAESEVIDVEWDRLFVIVH